MKKKTRNKIDGLFVPLLLATIDSPAWRAMSHGARSLYVALKRRCNQNDDVFLSGRVAGREINSHRDEVMRWFGELQHFGFIMQTRAGHLGVDGMGKAARWRLTELRYRGKPATKDFTRWDGTPYETESRPGKPGHPWPGKPGHPGQNPNKTLARFSGPYLESNHLRAVDERPCPPYAASALVLRPARCRRARQ